MLIIEDMPTMKKCGDCKKVLSKDNFYKNKQTKDGLDFYCRRCQSEKKKKQREESSELVEKHRENGREWYVINKEYKKAQNKEWRENNISKFRNINLKRRFGITLEEYDSILNKQKDCCAICGIHKDEFSYQMVVDHSHTTGKVRGVLCRKCNLGIGHLNDDISLLEKSIEYLNKHK